MKISFFYGGETMRPLLGEKCIAVESGNVTGIIDVVKNCFIGRIRKGNAFEGVEGRVLWSSRC